MLAAYMDEIRAQADPARAEGMARYHKVRRVYLGVPNPVLNDLARDWRRALEPAERVGLAAELWDSDIFEARLAAAKLLTQARIRPDDGVWALICSWVPDFDSWAIADHACIAAQKRLVADPARLDQVAAWTGSRLRHRRSATDRPAGVSARPCRRDRQSPSCRNPPPSRGSAPRPYRRAGSAPGSAAWTPRCAPRKCRSATADRQA